MDGEKERVARLVSENARLAGHVETLVGDLEVARKNARLFSGFSISEIEALVEYGKALQDRRDADARATCELIRIGHQRKRKDSVAGKAFRYISDWSYRQYNRFT